MNLTRRSFIKSSIFGVAAASVLSGKNHLPQAHSELIVNLEGNAENLGDELVSFGVPLPPNLLSDAKRVRILAANGEELSAAVRSLEPWRIGGRSGSIRSLLVQFKLDFRHNRSQKIRIAFHQPRQKTVTEFAPIESTLIDNDGLKGPRVHALLPARWLCDSWIAGPQTPVEDSAEYPAYDDFVGRNFPGSLGYLKSQVYHEW